MKVKMLVAVLSAALVAGVGGTTSVATADPPGDLKLAPKALNFGGVTLGSSVTKPVTFVNRTGHTLTYTGAYWPNFGNPSGWPGWPYGFWQVGSFSCLTLDPNESCTEDFSFKPWVPGSFATYFQVWYTDDAGKSYTDTTLMRGTGIAP